VASGHPADGRPPLRSPASGGGAAERDHVDGLAAASPSPPVRPAFVGAVLCGGASRRMGRDKALVDLHGEPLVLVGVRALRGAGAGRVAAVGGDEPALKALGLEVIADEHPGEGPLGGLITALRWAPVDPVVVLSCDLVALGPEEVGAVLDGLAAEAGADVAAPLRGGQPQFLTAAYRRRSLGPLEERFRTGERAVRAPRDPPSGTSAARSAVADWPHLSR